MEKLLSVVIPVYNTEKYLKKCLDSVLVPEYMDELDIIVIIDGSPDNSLSIARKYEIKYPNTFKVIVKENGGHGSCCNVGLKEARGKYIRFLDSDDWFDNIDFPEFLNSLVNLDADLIQTNVCKEIEKKGKTIKESLYRELPITIVHEFQFNPQNYFITIHCSTFKTSVLRESDIFFSEKTMYDDTSLYVQPFASIKTIKTLGLCVYHYYIGRPGQTILLVSDKAINNKKSEFSKLLKEYNSLRSELSENVIDYVDSFINHFILKDFYNTCVHCSDLRKSNKVMSEWIRYISMFDFILPQNKKINQNKFKYDWFKSMVKLNIKKLVDVQSII